MKSERSGRCRTEALDQDDISEKVGTRGETIHRGSVVTIRFTILFLRVSIRFGSLKYKHKLSVNCQLDR